MNDDAELELLLSLDGASYEAAEGYLVEFKVQRTNPTATSRMALFMLWFFVLRAASRMYVLIMRTESKAWAANMSHCTISLSSFSHYPKFVKAPVAYDHWRQTEEDAGRPYGFTTAAQLLNDFWREVKRTMNERGIPNDL